jgi:hypothetical protein
MHAVPDDNRQRFSRALGEAVLRIWGNLPQEVQQHLFEDAVSAQGETWRSPLAVFLHDHHPRTSAAIKAQAMIEPDSLGG